MTAKTTRAASVITDVPQPLNMTHKVVDGKAWTVAWKQGGFRHQRQVSDHSLAALCEWAARYADNATLIVTPLP